MILGGKALGSYAFRCWRDLGAPGKLLGRFDSSLLESSKDSCGGSLGRPWGAMPFGFRVDEGPLEDSLGNDHRAHQTITKISKTCSSLMCASLKNRSGINAT